MKNITKETNPTANNDVLSELKNDPIVKIAEISISANNKTEWWYQKSASGKVIHYLRLLNNQAI